MEHFFYYVRANLQSYVCVWKKYIVIFHTITLEIMHPRYHIHAIISSVVITDWPCVATYQMCFVWSALFESTLAPRRSIAFRNSAGTWSRAPGKQFGVLDRWRDRHTRPARWSDTLRIRPVRWRKWNRIRIDLARLADPIDQQRNLYTNVEHDKTQQQVVIYYTNKQNAYNKVSVVIWKDKVKS